MSSNPQCQYDISLDDVRDYLLHSGAVKEAESFLHVVETEERQKEENESQIAREMSHFKPTLIKDRIQSEREKKRDEILKHLLTEKRNDAAGMLQEEEEMRRLQVVFLPHYGILPSLLWTVINVLIVLNETEYSLQLIVPAGLFKAMEARLREENAQIELMRQVRHLV